MTRHSAAEPASHASLHLASVPSRPASATDTAALLIVTTGDHAQVDVVDLRSHPCGAHLLDEIAAAVPGPAGSEVIGARGAAALIRSFASPGRLPPLAAVPPVQVRIELCPEQLSPREHEVLELIIDGLTNQEIADRLYLSINTIKSRVRSCYRKIDVERRAQAVTWGLCHGVGPRPGP